MSRGEAEALNTEDRLEEFRLALSYLAKVERDLDDWDNIKDEERLDVTGFDKVRRRYGEHQRQAARAVKACRRNARNALEPLETELKDLRASQRKLSRRLMKGSVDATKANAENRGLTRGISNAEAEIQVLRLIVDAEDLAEVGGAVDLTLEKFEERVAPAGTAGPPEPAPKKINWDGSVVTLVIGAIFILAISLVTVRSLAGSADGQFRAMRMEGDPDLVRVVCHNAGSRSLFLYAPWPEGVSSVPFGAPSPGDSYGVLLYLLDEDGAKLVPVSEGSWKYRGRFLVDSGPLEVRPGLTANLILDTRVLRELGVEAEAEELRLVFTRSGGAEAGRFDVRGDAAEVGIE